MLFTPTDYNTAGSLVDVAQGAYRLSLTPYDELIALNTFTDFWKPVSLAAASTYAEILARYIPFRISPTSLCLSI
jgi:hypothetical protein